jgi:ABC-type branched-subunit amino acid transport system substrate-binding protein
MSATDGGGNMRKSRFAAFAALVAVLAVVMSALAAGAQTTTTGSGGSGGSSTNEIGITAKEIKLAVLADVENSISPGLFKKSVDAMNAWARVVNKAGGIAGRKIVIDFHDTKLNPTETRNAIIQACANDFATVGGESLFMSNVDDLVGCKDANGDTTGLPDVPGLALDVSQKCSPVTWQNSGDATFCATRDQSPQTYKAQQGEFLYYTKVNQNLHGVWTLPSDLKATRDSEIPIFQAGVNLGIKKDGQGFYDTSARAQQSELTPIIQVVKQNNSNWVYNGNSAGIAALLRKEAIIQGANSVKVWACNIGCYSTDFLDAAAGDGEGESSGITMLPFYTEWKNNPTMKKLVTAAGGIDNVNSSSVSSWIAAILFQDAATKAAAKGNLTRKSLMEALAAEHNFDADGITGPFDVGAHQPPLCYVMTAVKNGKWVRTYPKQVGKFDCNPKNLVTIKLDVNDY